MTYLKCISCGRERGFGVMWATENECLDCYMKRIRAESYRKTHTVGLV